MGYKWHNRRRNREIRRGAVENPEEGGEGTGRISNMRGAQDHAPLKAGSNTYRVPWLLSKDLSKLDQLSVCVCVRGFKRLGEVDHRVRRVLLIAGASSGEERLGCGLGDGIALITSACLGLRARQQRIRRYVSTNGT